MRRVLWTLVPIGSLGLLGWVPPLRIAFRRKNATAWLWFAGSAAAFVLVIVLTSTVRVSDVDNTPPTWVGLVEILNIIFTALYTAVASKALTPKPKPAPVPPAAWDVPGRGYGYGYGYGYAPAPAPAPAAGYGYGGYPAPPQAYPTAPPVAEPSSARPNDVAAEVQAELRELRDLLGESAARAREGRDVRGEQ